MNLLTYEIFEKAGRFIVLFDEAVLIHGFRQIDGELSLEFRNDISPRHARQAIDAVEAHFATKETE